MLENNYLSNLLKKSKQVVAVLFTRDAATFLFFLILAFMFWLMHSSSAERNMKMKVPIIYTGIPQQIDFLDSLPKSVTVILRDKGSLLWPYYFKDIHPITIDLTNSFSGSGNLDYSMTESVNQLLTQFPGTTILQDIEFSHFGVAYRVLEKRTVPIKVDDYTPLLPYVLRDSIEISPRQVDVYGTLLELDTIRAVYLRSLPRQIIKRYQGLHPLDQIPGVKIEPDFVTVLFDVEMSTEKSIIKTIEEEGFPFGLTLRTFPEEVKVIFNVGVSRFQDINSDDFRVVLSYDSIRKNGAKSGTLTLKHYPDDVFDVRILPSEVEYIIEAESH